MSLFREAMIIIVILVAGMLINLQAVNKNKVMLDVKSKNAYEVSVHNQVNYYHKNKWP